MAKKYKIIISAVIILLITVGMYIRILSLNSKIEKLKLVSSSFEQEKVKILQRLDSLSFCYNALSKEISEKEKTLALKEKRYLELKEKYTIVKNANASSGVAIRHFTMLQLDSFWAGQN